MAEKAAAISLAKFLPADSFEIEIQSATGEPTGWHITLAGPSHPQTIATAETLARRALRKAEQIEAAQVNGRKHKPEERDVAAVRRENVEGVVSRILDWNPIDVGDGPVPFTKEAATELLLRPDMGWALIQLAEALAGDQAFTRR